MIDLTVLPGPACIAHRKVAGEDEDTRDDCSHAATLKAALDIKYGHPRVIDWADRWENGWRHVDARPES